MPRIVSLLPSATEIVCALGARDDLTGVSHECDWPHDVVGLPLLTRAKMMPSPSSLTIDRSVRDVVRQALHEKFGLAHCAALAGSILAGTTPIIVSRVTRAASCSSL